MTTEENNTVDNRKFRSQLALSFTPGRRTDPNEQESVVLLPKLDERAG